MKTGTANLPLHSGRAPAWLFDRMKLQLVMRRRTEKRKTERRKT